MLIMTPAQSRAARALLNMTQPQLAARASLGLSTVVDFERSRRAVSPLAQEKMTTVLERAGVLFIDADTQGPGVRLRDVPPPA